MPGAPQPGTHARPALVRSRAGGRLICGDCPTLPRMGVISSIKQRFKYFTAKADARFNERADPKVQLEQAIAEAQDKHRRLKEQAANVIANQKQSELRLNAKMGE